MKHLNSKRRAWTRAIQRIRTRHNRRRCLIDAFRKGVNYVPQRKTGSIKAPGVIDIYGRDGRELALFFQCVRRAVLNDKRKAELDFRETSKLRPAATLLLFAEVDRVIQLSTVSDPLTIRPPKQRRPREVMKQLGLLDLGGKMSNVVPKRGDVIYWKATRGRDQNGELPGLALEHVVQHAESTKPSNEVQLDVIWRGVSEALNNTTDHAYVSARGDGYTHGGGARWWMFTHLRDNVLVIAICDLGVGYAATTPRTIPEAFGGALKASLSGQNRDCQAIQLAMEYGRSSTRQSHRGKGSRDALSVLERHGQGELIIASRTGQVEFSKKHPGSDTVKGTSTLSANILGTIIESRWPLSPGEFS